MPGSDESAAPETPAPALWRWLLTALWPGLLGLALGGGLIRAGGEDLGLPLIFADVILPFVAIWASVRAARNRPPAMEHTGTPLTGFTLIVLNLGQSSRVVEDTQLFS